jgi:hypothetical protein
MRRGYVSLELRTLAQAEACARRLPVQVAATEAALAAGQFNTSDLGRKNRRHRKRARR